MSCEPLWKHRSTYYSKLCVSLVSVKKLSSKVKLSSCSHFILARCWNLLCPKEKSLNYSTPNWCLNLLYSYKRKLRQRIWKIHQLNKRALIRTSKRLLAVTLTTKKTQMKSNTWKSATNRWTSLMKYWCRWTWTSCMKLWLVWDNISSLNYSWCMIASNSVNQSFRNRLIYCFIATKIILINTSH